MAVILSNSLFIHIPKTGGTWICAALKNAELIKNRCKFKHPSLTEFRTKQPELLTKTLKVFSFIRNPVTWWQSRWSDPFMRDHFVKGLKVEKQPWINSIRWLNYESMITRQKQYDDFNAYIHYILNRRPGFAGEYFRFMTNVKDIDLGKYEDIEKDLIEILYRSGEDFNVNLVKNTEKKNESDPTLKQRRFYTEENLKKIIDAEKKIMDLYGYSTKVSDYAHLIK